MDGYRTLDNIDINDIYYGPSGIMAAIDQYRRVDIPIIPALATPWPESIMKYGVSEKNGFQLLGPSQLPDRKMIQMATIYPRVSKYGYAVGTDLDTLLRSTGREIMLDLNRPFAEDPENILTRFMEVMMVGPGINNQGSGSPGQIGYVPGYGWFNGQYAPEEQLTAPPRYQQRTFPSNHTHYLTSAAPNVLTINDLNALKGTIRHHGNTNPLAGFVSSATVTVLENAASWQGGPAMVRSPISDQVAVSGFGDTFQLNGVVYHATEMMPDNYVLLVEFAGNELGRPLVMYEPANLKGLRLHPGPQGAYPLIESYLDRWFGLKVVNRGAGAVMFFGTHSGTYVSPTIT